MQTLSRTEIAPPERTILRYHGNTLAIIKAMKREMVGAEKTMIFTPGYGSISLLRTAAGLTAHKRATYLAERSTHS